MPEHASGTQAGIPDPKGGTPLTLIWLIIWFVANAIGDRQPLLTDPVNVWTGTLILAIALDLGRQHAPDLGRTRPGATDE
jgi:hypothetical protein